MKKKEKDIALFVAFCIEEYGQPREWLVSKFLTCLLNMALQNILASFTNRFTHKAVNG